MALINFDDAKWGSVAGTELCDTGGPGDTLTDTALGVDFIIGEGSMEVFSPHGHRILFFSRVDCNNTDHGSATLVIRFDTPQEYVRFKLYMDQPTYLRAAYYREHNQTDRRENRTIISGAGGTQITENVVYNSSDGVKEVAIVGDAPENTFYELEFHASLSDIQHDIALALDGSGSMSAQGKWGAMIEAADIFHDLYSEFGDSSDGFGAVRFRWDCGNQLGGNQTTSQPSLNPLSASVDVPNLYAGDAPSGCTPIGEGAIQAANMVTGGGNPANHLLLLTDGKNNRGRSVANASNDQALNGVTVHTLGLGTGVHIDPVEITSIANDHAGNFRQTSNPSEVLDFFAESLGEMLGKVEIAAITGGTATIAPGTNKAAFLIAWDNPAQSHHFDLVAPSGATVDHANLPNLQGINISYHPSSSGSAHSYFVVEGNISGDWQFQNTPTGADTIALEDLDLRIQWALTPQLGATGQPINLQARITYQGEPYEGDVTVTAEATRPGEAVGDFLAEELRSNPVSPQLKGDVSQRGRIISEVLERNDRADLLYETGPDLAFESEGDGVFALKFTDTSHEGVYRFDLRAEGRDESGELTFARRATRFCTLRPSIDGAQTDIQVEPLDNDLYSVTVTPVTPTGNFAGPFLADQLTVQTTDGTLVKQLQDNLDGSYTQIVRTSGDPPRNVAIGVQDRTIPVGSPSTQPSDRLPWILAAVLLVLLVLLVLWVLL